MTLTHSSSISWLLVSFLCESTPIRPYCSAVLANYPIPSPVRCCLTSFPLIPNSSHPCVSLCLCIPPTQSPPQLCPGRPYNEHQAQQAVASVYSLDLFDSVDLHLRPDEQWGHAGAVAVDVVARERALAGVQADMDWMVVPGRGGGGGGQRMAGAADWGRPRLVSTARVFQGS